MLKDAKLDDDLKLEDIAKKTNHYSGMTYYYYYNY